MVLMGRQARKENHDENAFDLGDLCVFAGHQGHPQIRQVRARSASLRASLVPFARNLLPLYSQSSIIHNR
jgi:hypothetical protein